MFYLADENIPLKTILALKNEGMDIISVRDVSPGAKDSDIIEIGLEQQRVIITFDKDFGELVFKTKIKTHGILLLRFLPKSSTYVTEILKKLFKLENLNFINNFTIVEEDKIKIVPLPEK